MRPVGDKHYHNNKITVQKGEEIYVLRNYALGIYIIHCKNIHTIVQLIWIIVDGIPFELLRRNQLWHIASKCCKLDCFVVMQITLIQSANIDLNLFEVLPTRSHRQTLRVQGKALQCLLLWVLFLKWFSCFCLYVFSFSFTSKFNKMQLYLILWYKHIFSKMKLNIYAWVSLCHNILFPKYNFIIYVLIYNYLYTYVHGSVTVVMITYS